MRAVKASSFGRRSCARRYPGGGPQHLAHRLTGRSPKDSRAADRQPSTYTAAPHRPMVVHSCPPVFHRPTGICCSVDRP